ncbi:alpha/beta hydrolase fold protein [Exiguobacterium sp. AT1b]|uniref:Alpha/beta hydrolase fold protein n=1 Tax=Exiguobacterium sp. (strain ATCC BAA-1283 / AT1b) TaxID=360911 RepID=C4L320_EXISA|nr:alpha/beta fold hydrolase [Exiguobacterium sp. AT1b]ACQ71294.1 alpha/beta hydrolase fold protein [Exiguobacterium sp. AT1b]
MNIDLRGVRYEVIHRGEGKPVLCLHGFTGNAHWVDSLPALPIRLVSPSLLQHGATEHPSVNRSTMSQQVKDLSRLLDTDDRPWTVVGYSLGGRIALTLAACDERVEHVIGISTTPGLLTSKERAARRRQDAELAQLIETEGIAAFVNRWENLPLWRQTEDMKRSLRKDRLAQHPNALANSLRSIGTGHMPSLWGTLQRLPRTDLIVGTDDLKFKAIAKHMQEERPDIKIYEISNAGHAPHIENASEFGTIIKKLILGGI